MWIAWLSLRLPRSDSRQALFRCPDDASTGAVPLRAAKWFRPGNRNTWRTSPITVPAMTGPAPNRPVRLVPGAPDGCGQLLVGVAQLGVEATEVGQELAAQLAAGLDDRIRWPDLLEDAGGLGALAGPQEVRDGDRREQGDDGDHDHDFNEGEAPTIFIQFLQHRNM